MKKLWLIAVLLLVGLTGYSQTEYKCHKFKKFTEQADGTYKTGEINYANRTFVFYNGNKDYTISAKLFIRNDDASGKYVWAKGDPDNVNAVGHWYIDRMTDSGAIYVNIADAGEYPYLYVCDDYINYWIEEGVHYRYYFTE